MSKEYDGSPQKKLDKEVDVNKDFSLPTYEEWKSAAKESLKGTAFEKLITQTYEGIDLQPICTIDDIRHFPHRNQKPGFSDYSRGTLAGGYLSRPWEICQENIASFPHLFNEALKYDLQRGQTAISLILDPATQKGLDSDDATVEEVGINGIAISTLEDLKTALADINLEKYPLHINPGFSGLEVIMMLTAFFKQQGKGMDRLKGSIDIDPLGYMVSHSGLPISLETAYDRMTMVTQWIKQHAPYLKTIGISGVPYHNCGADAVRELAFVLATGVEYIDRLLERSMVINDLGGQMRFTFGIGSFYFMEIAKIRAARILWSKIIQAYGGDNQAQKMTIHARTSSYNQTKYDPHVNILRTTTEAFSAVAAGVDSLHTNLFNETFGNGDEFSRRVARNIQIILREECRLDRLIDPAGGSYYLEKLTAEVCQKSWKLFQEIEAMGGMFKALEKGFPQDETNSVHQKRCQDAARQKFLIIGTNYSADSKEKKAETNFPDWEEVYQERNQYLKNYKINRPKDQKSSFSKKLKTDSIIPAGAEAFLAGATIGEINQKFLPGVTGCITGAVFFKSVLPGLRRTAENFEELRDAVEMYRQKTGSKPKVFLAAMGPISQHKARVDFSRTFFEVGGFQVISPQFPQGQGFTTPEAAVEAALESKAPVVVICSTDDTYPQLAPPITQALKKCGILVVLAGYPRDREEILKQADIDEFIYKSADVHQILSRVLKQLGVLS